MATKEMKTSDSSQSRSSKGNVAASLRLGKAIRRNLAKKYVSSKFALISNESLDLSPMSEISDGVRSDEHVNSKFGSVSNKSLDLPLNSEVSGGVHTDEGRVVDPCCTASPDAFSLLELTPVSKITYDKHEYLDDMSAEYPHSGKSINSKMRSIEADVIIQHLKSAWIQIQRSNAVDIQSKKLIETLINTVIEVFYGISEESDILSKVLQAKTRITVTCLLVWMMCILVVVYVKCHTDSDTRFDGPLPT